MKLEQRVAEIVVGECIIRPQAQRRLEMQDCLGDAAGLSERHAEAVVGKRVVRLEAKRSREFFDGRGQLTVEEHTPSKVMVRTGVVGAFCDRVAPDGCFGAVVAIALECLHREHNR